MEVNIAKDTTNSMSENEDTSVSDMQKRTDRAYIFCTKFVEPMLISDFLTLLFGMFTIVWLVMVVIQAFGRNLRSALKIILRHWQYL